MSTLLVCGAAILAYLSVGLVLARIFFLGWLGDSPRTLPKKCNDHYRCYTPMDDRGHHYTEKFREARVVARFAVALWPMALIVVVIAHLGLVLKSGFGRVVYAPTKTEKLTERERERAKLAARAKELGLAVPEEWTQEEDRLEPRDRAWIDERTKELGRLRETEELKIRNRYGQPVVLERKEGPHYEPYDT